MTATTGGAAFFGLWGTLRNLALGLLFPAVCVGCGSWGELLCAACEGALERLERPWCPQCGVPLDGADRLCRRCQRNPLSIDGLRSAFWLQGAMRQGVHEFKYGGVTALGDRLGDLLSGFVATEELPVDVVVPVPLHPRRENMRGYNQARWLAERVALAQGLEMVEDCLARWRDTPSQIRAGGPEARRNNVAGAFGCRDDRLRGRDVLLVDDVCTTGATMDACASALKEAGVRSVWGVTLAREP